MTIEPPLIEVREWGRPARRLMLTRPLLFGRDCVGEVLADDGISRQHLRLVPSPTALSVVDLGSRNGTTVNGVALTGRAALVPGDVVRFGRSEIIVLHTPTVEPVAIEHDATRLSLRPVGPVVPPPPAPAAAAKPAVALANRLLGIDSTGTRDLFPAFTELPTRITRPVWQATRIGSLACFAALVVALFLRPAGGLFVLFGVIVPLLPLVFLVAPGWWRNVCPLAAANQIPRVLGFSRALEPPEWLRSRGYLVAVALFFGIAGSRLAGLDRNGAGTGVVLGAAAIAAFAGGVVFKGKSGWCSSICPLFPLQRAYGQTPFVTVPNSHCAPCVGCAKNCYDFTPRAAYQADLADADPGWSAPRKLFAGALPGFVLGFFTLAEHSETSAPQRFGLLALFLLVGIGSFFALDAITPLSPGALAVGYAAVALNAFYWFVGPVLAESFAELTAAAAPWLRWPISVAVLVLTLVWIARTRIAELQFALTTGARTQPVLLPFPRIRPPDSAPPGTGTAQVRFEPDGAQVVADAGMSLLDIAERGGRPIEAGCRMGVCGADPIAVLDGMSCLSGPERDELNTVRRLGLGKNTRMACCARISAGAVTVSLTPEPADSGGSTRGPYDRSIVSVVVIGNGIAGVTAADFIRRGHPDCEIHLVGRESHAFYNRMGISRLVYGRSAMRGLFLLPEQWYDEHEVTAWLNTLAIRVDVRERRVFLGTGEVLPYDRLILAMGASSALPSIEGLDRPGCFVLREASDALRIRAYAQERRCRHAVVAGGGLLGLEAAYALHQLGLRVTVLERGDRLLSRQIDARCAELVHQHFDRLGIEVRRRAETARIVGGAAVSGVALTDGSGLSCDLFLTATGIRPNVELARAAGIPVGRGVLVDDWMRTRVPGVYAAGDVAEHRGQVFGLWPIATEQAQAAALNALGGATTVVAETPATILKGVGLELFSIGRVTADGTDHVIVVDRPALSSYRRLVLSEGRAVGATVLGHHPADLAAAQHAVRHRVKISSAALNDLRAGDWSSLASDGGYEIP
ncbi:FAD-dependent oxidoreductase [Nocardia sp. GCM10030253]|uniref:FAD-dependent oxidoreductase n=1 Tax=Nocardia sp. GCM10030253 TaxID=3273404 RepID=UPI003630E03C